MASIIRIKRSSVSGNPGTLGAGELAYSALTDNGSNGGDRLYIGIGSETSGNAANHYVIGGKFFTDRLDHTAGTLTASSALVVDSDSKIDILNVDNLTLNGNTLSSTDTNGNLLLTPNGTGKTVITNAYIGDTSTSLQEYIEDIAGGQVVGGSGIDATYNDTAGTTTIALNTEYTQDLVGAMITGSSQSGISVSYDDANGKLDFNVNDPTITLSGDISGSATMTNLGDITITATIQANSVALGTDTTGNYVATVADAGNGNITVSGSGSETSAVTLDLANTTVIAGSYGSASAIPTFTVDAQGRLTAAGTASISTTLNIAGDSGTDAVALGTDTLTISGGEGIDVAVTNNTITVSAEDATSSNKGVASFSSSDFSVVSGAVTISNVNLGSQTTGNYVATIAGTTNQVSVSGSGSETSAVTLSLPQNIHSGATPSFAGMSLSGALAMGSNAITGLSDPVNPQDAATKSYVDAARAGLDVKQSARAATTANITLSGTQTIDGVALSVGDRVLVKNQSNAVQNGIYVVASGAWSRSTDADEPNEVSPGLFLFVEEGSLNGDNGYVVSSDGPLTVGTDAIVFTQFSGAGAIVAGAALVKTGDTLDVQVAASGGIEIVSDALQLKSSLAGDGLAYASGVLSLASASAGSGLAYASGVLSVNTANGLEVSGDNVQLASSVAGDGLTYNSGVLAVGGTADKITVSADAITIASTYVGQTSITTLGTITTGTWNGTAIANAYLENSSVTVNGTSISLGSSATITANTTNAITFNTTGGAAAGSTFNGSTAKTIDYSTVGAAPTVGSTDITTLGTITTGTWNGTTIASAYGGTGLTTYTTGDLIYASATNTLSKRAAGADGQVLQINSSGVPVWGDIDGGTY